MEEEEGEAAAAAAARCYHCEDIYFKSLILPLWTWLLAFDIFSGTSYN